MRRKTSPRCCILSLSKYPGQLTSSKSTPKNWDARHYGTASSPQNNPKGSYDTADPTELSELSSRMPSSSQALTDSGCYAIAMLTNTHLELSWT
jgi:hypothetical protein